MTGSIDKPGANVKLRPARAGDVNGVRAIIAAAASDLTARFGEGHWSHVRAVETLRKYVEQGTLYLIETDAVTAGTLRLTDRKIPFYRGEWFAEPKAKTGYLLDMAIDPAYQRRGIGRLAMMLAENHARSCSLQAIRLDAYGGPAGAGAFYRKCGYRLVHRGAFNGIALEYFEKLL
jgi:GNAT superfamily N-acetyltransferase